MLEKITIHGFKSIESMEGLELKNINVLVGGNGAGKSNLIEFFKMPSSLLPDQYAKIGFRAYQANLPYPEEKVKQVVAMQHRLVPIYAARGKVIVPWSVAG